ncbi:MAG: DUF4136 domain-containing protein [Flavobacteriaceae bacterium]|nr:DUF4136 domain-containing protein [Muriicola sp.]MBT8290809.1 DUF4136 domain-containing protein [Muriicola sp.]NNK21359.1 DUF4136 domain-containing protein [Flavobacteriaceae bacterium]NNK36008.1 DUF4136 domain-containing protein [Eudoraea sp.]NNL39240.1 DUF4136 domain-containing protein [Flavobacteriaceae bacterium]
MKKKILFFLPLALMFLASSCVSVRVIADYDRNADFNTYKSYAFYKTGIDKAQISDLDKKRILRAIENEMANKGFVKSENPDLLVSIFTKERERVDIYNNAGWGWGWGWGPGWGYWNPWLWGGPGWGNNISTRTEGSLYIDLIDTSSKELIWQGRGVGTLNNTGNIEKKEERIREFVSQILEKYPPNTLTSS